MTDHVVLQGARQLGLISLVPTFDSPVTEASDSSDEDDAPPPLPPPRTESLLPDKAVENGDHVMIGSKMITINDCEPLNSLSNHVNGDLNGVSGSGSGSSSSSEHSPSKCILTNNKLEEKKR